jgi:nucleoside triphosphate pyrophosphatase
VEFEVRPAHVVELEEGDAEDVALENARRKAHAVARPGDAAVLGVDTVVALGDTLYGKPSDQHQARATLTALSGATHRVVSGVTLLRGATAHEATATTMVTFHALDPPTIDSYLATGEWRERAGGYAIQGRGADLVHTIDGDYDNVVGLPVAVLLRLWPSLIPG